MPKHDKNSPKGIAIRMKAKGLLKLKYYCEMCQKQCRDANGFKCHQTTEGHLRQMRLFSEDPSAYMDTFSKELESTYLDILKRRHGTKWVKANKVYQEYIAFRQHVHMNSTRWVTLSHFIKYLGRTSKVSVEERDDGLYIRYINRNLNEINYINEEKMKANELITNEKIQQNLIEKQRKALLKNEKNLKLLEATELKNDDNRETIELKFNNNINNNDNNNKEDDNKIKNKTKNIFKKKKKRKISNINIFDTLDNNNNDENKKKKKKKRKLNKPNDNATIKFENLLKNKKL